MVSFARALSERGLDVLTFNFLYTEQRRKVPDRMPQLVACYRAAIDAARARGRERARASVHRRQVDGRSRRDARRRRGRRADLAGIVLLGYPLHPPGKPDQLRDAHLPNVGRPMLFVQGTRDTFGTPSELKPILASLSPLPTLHHVEGGDHSFKIAGPRRQGAAGAVYGEIQDTIVEWIRARPARAVLIGDCEVPMSLRPVKDVRQSVPTMEGAGVSLRRAFGFGNTSDFDPFLLLDDFRNDNPDAYLAGFPWHPHRGIETITYVLAGTVEHGDSLGNRGQMGAGDVQWMTAGSGILHQEMPKGDPQGRMHGFQLWSNLPSSLKMTKPRYQDISATDIPEVDRR